jgi:hypothetical protein
MRSDDEKLTSSCHRHVPKKFNRRSSPAGSVYAWRTKGGPKYGAVGADYLRRLSRFSGVMIVLNFSRVNQFPAAKFDKNLAKI